MTSADESDVSLPVVEFETVRAADPERIAGILLAAGESRRYGPTNKLLEPIDGIPLIVRAAETLIEAGLDPIVAVLGADAAEVRDALAETSITCVVAEDYAVGRSRSVGAGLEALPPDIEAVVIALGDMPAVSPRSVRALVQAYRLGEGNALASAYEGTRGNPVLFGRPYFDRLGDLSEDRGGRELLLSVPDAALVESGDRGVVVDVDRPEDVSRVCALCGERS